MTQKELESEIIRKYGSLDVFGDKKKLDEIWEKDRALLTEIQDRVSRGY